MDETNIPDKLEIYILDHEKCGKCNNICYIGLLSHPFSCCDGTLLPKYVLRYFMSDCQNFDKRTKTSVIVPELNKELELHSVVK
jgi:hypothetical protein